MANTVLPFAPNFLNFWGALAFFAVFTLLLVNYMEYVARWLQDRAKLDYRWYRGLGGRLAAFLGSGGEVMVNSAAELPL